MTTIERFRGCIIGGAIGDAFGSSYENETEERKDVFYPFGKPVERERHWNITDDTQLTLATCEAILKDESLNPSVFADHFLYLYRQRKLSGIGSSTLKALTELDFGGDWSQVGRKGEYAAGNGAAMRIAPLAFCENISRSRIREICSITHNSDEAYVGALSVVIAIREIVQGNWTGDENLIELLIPQLPDTRLRDRLIEIKDVQDIFEVGNGRNGGYVVDSVPLAIAAANKVKEIGIEKMFQQLIEIGGDTDTNCSIAGQIAGALIGLEKTPLTLVRKLQKLDEYKWIDTTIQAWIKRNEIL